jgi:hypothetical protein
MNADMESNENDMKPGGTNGAILITSRSVGAGFLYFLLVPVGKWIQERIFTQKQASMPGR